MVAQPVLEWTPPVQSEATCHMTPSVHPLFQLTALFVQTCSAQVENCFVKLQPLLVFACYCVQICFQ